MTEVSTVVRRYRQAGELHQLKVCPDCGSTVWDTRDHDAWHEALRPAGDAEKSERQEWREVARRARQQQRADRAIAKARAELDREWEQHRAQIAYLEALTADLQARRSR